VTRTILAAAVFLAVALFVAAPAAEACISCSYTPEVVNTPVGKAPPKGKRAAKKRPPVERAARPDKKRVVKRPPPAQEEPAVEDTAAAKDGDTPVKDAGAATEGAVETAKTTTTEEAPADVDAPSGSATTAFAKPRPAPGSEPPAGEATCKKFSATAGTTVTVPCE